jgi:hypothetical protein
MSSPFTRSGSSAAILSIGRANRDLRLISTRSSRPANAGSCIRQGNRFRGLHRAISLHRNVPSFFEPALPAAGRPCKLQGGLEARFVLCNLRLPTGAGRPTPRQKMKRCNALPMRLAASIFREDHFSIVNGTARALSFRDDGGRACSASGRNSCWASAVCS